MRALPSFQASDEEEDNWIEINDEEEVENDALKAFQEEHCYSDSKFTSLSSWSLRIIITSC